MAVVAAALLLVVSLRVITADVSLNVQQEVVGMWKGSVVLPCSYSPVDLTREKVIWLFDRKRIFESDSRGDHTLVTQFRGKVQLPEDLQGGDVSLTITNLQTDDKGLYTCQVSLMPRGSSQLINKEADITLDVRKVAVTKPVIRPGGSSLKVSRGSTVNLLCAAEGSPPIYYRWYKSSSSGATIVQASRTSLTIENVDPSHSGTYYCEAENTIGEKTVQQSQILELSVTDEAIEPTNVPGDAMHSSFGMITSRPPASTVDDRHGFTAPTATEAGTLRQTPLSTRNMLTGSAGPPGDRRRQSTDGTLRRTPLSTRNMLTGSAGPPGDRRRQTTGASGSSGLPLYVIILIALLCLVLLCALIAVLATRRTRKGSGQISEMPAMSALAAQDNQAPPAVNICQINISQNNGCENVTMARVENAYQPVMTKEPVPDDSAYQNLLIPSENEYDLPLTPKEKMWES